MKFTKNEVWRGKFIKVIKKEFLNRSGNKAVWECVERVNSKEIVAIFAVTKKKELILTKQFRFPLEGYIIELPAGLTDKVGESLKQTAKRELLEETGYLAKKLIFVHQGPFNAGMNNSEIAVFYAPDVDFIGADHVAADENEDIEVIKVPLASLVGFCAGKHKNFKIDLKILGTLKILEQKKLLKY